MRLVWKYPFLVAAVLVLGLAQPGFAVTVNLTIQGDEDTGPVKSYLGIIHGFNEDESYPQAKMDALNITSWRIGQWWQYDYPKTFTDNITFVLSDGWGYTTNPADNWSNFEDYIEEQVDYSVDNDLPIAYWDIWNEPDSQYFWSSSWSYADCLETFERAYDVIKDILPDAKVLGPSFSRYAALDNFSGLTTDEFITDLYDDHGVLLEAISWHQNDGLSWYIPDHVDDLEDAIASIGGGYDPELVINEYGDQSLMLQPVSNANFVYNFDKTGIAFATLFSCPIYQTCGLFPQTYDNCWRGLNGLFMEDNSTVQHNYWFWKWHGEETGVRLVASEPELETFACASKDTTAKTIKIFLGRFDKASSDDVAITIEDYPFTGPTATVEVTYLPDEHQVCSSDPYKPIEVSRTSGPAAVSSGTETISGGDLSFTISGVDNREVYFIKVTDYTAPPPPGKATSPSPSTSATGVDSSTDLSWTAGSGATSHDVYFGTSNPPSFVQNQAGTTYDPGALNDDTTYYWRIDEVNSSGTTTGDVWSFTTWPNLYEPDAVSTIQGSAISGNLASCISNDNNFYVSGSHTAPAAQFEFTLDQSSGDVTELRVKARSKDQFLFGNTRYVYLWNNDTSQFDVIGSNSVSTLESNVEFTVTSNPEDYVNGSNKVKMAVSHWRSSTNHQQYVEYVELGVNGG